MPYNSETSTYERRAATVIDATPDGDTVAVAIDVKLDQGIDDYVADLNHHSVNGNHYPVTSVGSDSRFLKQSPAGAVSWADGVVAANAALKDFSNVAGGAIAPAKVAQDASNRFVTDAEKSTWNASASESAKGLVELATTAEAAAGADTSRAVTAAGVDAYHKANNINLGVAYTIVGNETAIDFGSDEDPIPAGVKRITVMFDGVSTNGDSYVQTQLGATTIKTSEYNANRGGTSGSLALSAAVSSGFPSPGNNGVAESACGSLVLTNLNTNIWTAIGITKLSATIVFVGGSVTLSGTLDRIRITTVNGTDQFDAGTINISWEF